MFTLKIQAKNMQIAFQCFQNLWHYNFFHIQRYFDLIWNIKIYNVFQSKQKAIFFMKIYREEKGLVKFSDFYQNTLDTWWSVIAVSSKTGQIKMICRCSSTSIILKFCPHWLETGTYHFVTTLTVHTVRNSKNSSWPVTGSWNRGPLKILNDMKLIMDDQRNGLI